jgi:CheY-like chemotaxis protein
VSKRLIYLSFMTFPKTLVAEDDPNDALLLHCAFKRAGIKATIHFVSDGMEAIDYLRGKQLFEKVASSTLPGLFLLDLEMPRLSGFGVLEWLRKHPHLRPYRVVVFSSSENAEDIVRATSLGADLCLPKTSAPEELANIIKVLQDCYSRPASQPDRAFPSPQNEFALQR